MTKGTIVVLACLALVTALPAAALPPRGAGPFLAPGGGPGAGGPPEAGGAGQHGRHLRALADFLDLTPEQREAAAALSEGLREAVEPLAAQIADLRAGIAELLDGDAPDPAAVGQALIDVHALGEEIAGLREAFDADFAALLTSDQLVRYEAFKAAVEALRAHRGGRRGGPR